MKKVPLQGSRSTKPHHISRMILRPYGASANRQHFWSATVSVSCKLRFAVS